MCTCVWVCVRARACVCMQCSQVMDPRYGLDMDQLKVCLDRCQEEDIVQNYNLQVTGGVNFSFTALKGTSSQRTCKPTVQKSGSIQVWCTLDA